MEIIHPESCGGHVRRQPAEEYFPCYGCSAHANSRKTSRRTAARLSGIILQVPEGVFRANALIFHGKDAMTGILRAAMAAIMDFQAKTFKM